MCLLLGITTSVIVAVGCMLWGPFPDLCEIQLRLTVRNWPRAVPADWTPPTARTIYRNAVHTLILHQAVRYADPTSDSTAGATHYQWLYQYGWPLRAFEAESRADLAGEASSRIGLVLPPAPAGLAVVPYSGHRLRVRESPLGGFKWLGSVQAAATT